MGAGNIDIDKIFLRYKIGKESTIRLFGDKFVDKNKNICKIKIILKGEKKHDLCSKYNYNNSDLSENNLWKLN